MWVDQLHLDRLTNPLVFKTAQNEPRDYAGETFHLLVALAIHRGKDRFPWKDREPLPPKVCERYRERRVSSH
jgi:hypothetical protein